MNSINIDAEDISGELTDVITSNSSIGYSMDVKKYKIDPDKIKSLNDLLSILEKFITIYEYSNEFDDIKHLLKEIE